MNQDCDFYICPVCFKTSESEGNCHATTMLHCASLQPGDEQLKPLMDAEGDLRSRAPRWFLENLRLAEN